MINPQSNENSDPNSDRDKDDRPVPRPSRPLNYRHLNGPNDIDNLPGVTDAAKDRAREEIEKFARESEASTSSGKIILASPDGDGGIILCVGSVSTWNVSDDKKVGAKGEVL